MSRLQVIISPQYDPFLNRAVEQYLTERQEEGVVTLYLWKNQQTVVIGFNQNPYAECNVKLLLDEGGHLMRRGTGGGAVYHDLGNINFSFIADKKLYDVKKQLSVIQDALLSYGLQTEISGRNDLTCQGRKFSGNAFAKGQRNNLHHGTILIKTDGAMMQRYLIVDKAKLLKNGVKSVASRVINLSELIPDLTSENIKQPLIASFETPLLIIAKCKPSEHTSHQTTSFSAVGSSSRPQKKTVSPGAVWKYRCTLMRQILSSKTYKSPRIVLNPRRFKGQKSCFAVAALTRCPLTTKTMRSSRTSSVWCMTNISQWAPSA